MTIALSVPCAAIVIIAIWRIASPALDSDFRRSFRTPSMYMLYGAAAVTAVTVLLVAVSPILVIGSGAAMSVLCISIFLGRGLDSARGVPPGSRSIVRSMRDLAHRDAYARRFEQYGPITLSNQFGRTVVCILGIERGQRLLREHRDSVGPSPLAFSQQMMGGFLRYMDDPTHDTYGPLFRRAMSRAVTDAVLPLVETSTRHLFEVSEPGTLDPRPKANELTQRVLLRALFGIDPDSTFGTSFLDALHSFGKHAIHHRANKSAERDFERVRELVMKATESAAESDYPSALSEMRNLDPSQPDPVSVDNLLFMWRIGSSNTAALLLWTLQHIGSNPEFRERLCANEPGIADAVVMESLRLSQSEYVYRKLRKSMEFDGFRLKKGWLVRICVAESHLDPSQFACPHQFTDRFLDTRPAQSVYAPFGFDRHACNSAGLASAIVATAVSTIAKSSDIDILPSTSLQRDFRHWSHWRPGTDLALRRATN